MLLQFICIYLHLKYKRSQEKLGGNVDHILYGKKWLFEDILCDVLQGLDFKKTDLHREHLKVVWKLQKLHILLTFSVTMIRLGSAVGECQISVSAF